MDMETAKGGVQFSCTPQPPRHVARRSRGARRVDFLWVWEAFLNSLFHYEHFEYTHVPSIGVVEDAIQGSTGQATEDFVHVLKTACGIALCLHTYSQCSHTERYAPEEDKLAWKCWKCKSRRPSRLQRAGRCILESVAVAGLGKAGRVQLAKSL